MDSAAVVLRRARSPRPRGTASLWWRGVKIPVPTPRAAAAQTKRCRRDPLPDPEDTDTEAERPAKRARRECFDCGVTETPLWRSGPMGLRTLCNACGIRYAESRRTEKRPRLRRSPRTAAAASGKPHQQEVESQPPVSGLVPVPVVLSTLCNCNSCGLWAAEALRATTTATTVTEEQPEQQQESRLVVSGSALSVPESSVRVPLGLDPGAHLPKEKSPAKQRVPQPPTTTDQSAPPPPPLAQEKKKAVEKRPYRPQKTGKRCLHCRSSSTPQWRGGPLGRSELCNACGMRYKQGGLMPEYRPLASPTFQPTQHSHMQWEVLHLHRRRKEGNRRRHATPPEQPGGGAAPDPIPLDDDGDDDQVLELIPLDLRPPSPPVDNVDDNLALALDHYHHHAPPPPEQPQQQRADGGAPDPILLDDDEENEVLEPIPLELRPPSPVENNLVLSIEYHHQHPAPPPEQHQQEPAGGGDDDEPTHVFQQPPLLPQQLPCPVDNLASSDDVLVGGIGDLANACARDNDDPMGEPSWSLDLNLDPFLLDGPAAPMLVDGDDAFFSFF
ncbi:hypothetical protein BS78_08G039700 [Paspalum vaginatum]|nr:hypothetical protein BS78_08G039700 [Paspalum vaginatum]